MEWTSAYPEVPGFYWIRNFVTKYGQQKGFNPYPEPRVVFLDLHLNISWIGNEVETARGELGVAAWFGPLTPPEGKEHP